MSEYILQIEKDESYPFEGIRQKFGQTTIRVQFVELNPEDYFKIQSNLSRLIKNNESTFIQMKTIREIKNKGFVIDYQYVHDLLHKNGDHHSLSDIRYKIEQFFEQLSRVGIRYFPQIDEIGITMAGEPKIYVKANFQYVEEDQRSHLYTQYRMWTEKLFQGLLNPKETEKSHSQQAILSEYSQKLDKKINAIEQRLSKIRNQKSVSNKKGNMVLEYLPAKKTRNNSYSQSIEKEKLEEKQTKFHRSSFGDYSNKTNNQIESTKDNSLTKRVSSALEKTQQALKIYEKNIRKARH